MYSVAVNNKSGGAAEINALIYDLVAREQHFSRWVENPASSLVHHDAECCEEARLWFLSYARSMEIDTLSQFSMKAPTWLQRLFTWGPTEWPISWCQVVKERVIDCGVFAALAREVFTAQGHVAHPAQALLSYNEACTDHWKSLWKGENKKPKKRKGDVVELAAKAQAVRKKSDRDIFPWIGDRIVYHELCLVEMPDGTAKIYDSTWGNWYEPLQRAGFGALLAVRTECPRLLKWGDKTISCGEWIGI
jgi:hypothetical protein